MKRLADIGKVYPRVGGGNRASVLMPKTRVGLSPRGRGKPARGQRTSPFQRSIPAWAGETGYCYAPIKGMKVYPRVGGGNPIC